MAWELSTPAADPAHRSQRYPGPHPELDPIWGEPPDRAVEIPLLHRPPYGELFGSVPPRKPGLSDIRVKTVGR